MQLWNLVVREVNGHLRSVRFRVSVLAAVMLGVLAIGLGAQDFQARTANFKERLDQNTPAEAPAAVTLAAFRSDVAMRVHRPPIATSVIVRGLEPSLPSYWDFSPAGLVTGPSDVAILPGSEAGPTVDFEGLVRVLLGFLAMLIAVGTVAGERSEGMLAALLAQPVQRFTVMASKYMGGLIALGGAIVLTVGSAAGFLKLYFPQVLTGEVRSLLVALGALSLIYLATLLSIGMAIAAVIRSERRALALSMTVWAVCSVGAPQVSTFMLRLFTPVQPRALLEESMKQLGAQRDIETQFALGTIYLTDPSPEYSFSLLPSIQPRIEQELRHQLETTREKLAPYERKWLEDSTAQNALAQRLSWATPATTFQQIAMAIADTGRLTHVRWTNSVQERQRRINALLFDDPPTYLMKTPRQRDNGVTIRSFNRRNYLTLDRIPVLTPPAVTLTERVREARVDLIVLGLQFLAALGLAVVVSLKARL